MDWSDCPLIEVTPRKLSRIPVLKGTRMQADSILENTDSIVENYEGGSPINEIAYNFSIPEETIRAVLAYAQQRRPLKHR